MNLEKRKILIDRLSTQPEPQLIGIDEFFDGNDDIGSIGCNLIEHPGVEAFRTKLGNVARRADVEAVYVQIAELDPGEDSWPFADMVLIVGTLPVADLEAELAELEPDEVGTSDEFSVPESLYGRNAKKLPVLAAWWD